MRIGILILAYLLTAAAALSKKVFQGEPRILGGEEAPLHEFPYHVGLYTTSSNEFYSGALITDRWVITTAYVVTRLPAEKTFALLGAHEPNNKEVAQQIIEIDKKILHQLYDDQNYYFNNIALLHLKTTAELDRFVSTIMLAPFNAPDFDGARLVATGFGYSAIGTPSKSLRFVVLNGISNSVCKRLRSFVDDDHVCVETTAGKGTCSFDLGAPLVDVDRGLLVGLLSSYGACGDPSFPGLFTRVSYYNKWIMDNMN